MVTKRIVWLVASFAALTALAMKPVGVAEGNPAQISKILGMYVHQHWPYNRPYAARTWTSEDWRGYADGLKRIGYNTLLIWPVLETMPDPLTPSDQANLEKISRVIDMLHTEFQMRAYIVLCPNVGANNAAAKQATFERRHFFYSDVRINPGNVEDLSKLIHWRKSLLKPLAKMDGIAIIDSDPGGYAGSTNPEFVNLLVEHRKLLDQLRPGIELYYWMHVGWPAYCRFYQTGKLSWGTEEEFIDAIERLKKFNPEPWGLAGGTRHPFEKTGLASRAVAFNYGRIEGEPSFPLTNFGGDAAYKGGAAGMERGVMGNAQTHCVQLPNTFAFARGAQGLPLTDQDYLRFAEELIPGKGEMILKSWQVIAGRDPNAMRVTVDRLEKVAASSLRVGSLKGLLFGDPKRFLIDLAFQLRVKAAYEEFLMSTENNQQIGSALLKFVEAAEVWQKRHGYQNHWEFPKMREALRKLNSRPVNGVLDYLDVWGDWFERNEGSTPFQRIQNGYRQVETYTPQLLAAMREAALQRR
jgi:hypothetical protein